jgi:5-methyltetrahydrofolate--homocysteine methyltransferase
MSKLFHKLREEKILLLDGAFGTQLYEKGHKDIEPLLMNVKSPSVVEDIYRSYISAGADIITTNTLTGNQYNLEQKLGNKYSDELVERANVFGVLLASNSAKADLVAGSIGPLGKIVAPHDSMETDEYFISMKDAHSFFRNHIVSVKKGFVDFLLFETFLNLDDAYVAVMEAEKSSLPIALSFSYNPNFASLDDITQVFSDKVDILGLNCVEGMDAAIDLAKYMKGKTDLPLMIYPNAGIPDANGKYSESAEYMASRLPKLLDQGVSIVGGCCGTTPEHIKLFREVIDDYKKTDLSQLNLF